MIFRNSNYCDNIGYYYKNQAKKIPLVKEVNAMWINCRYRKVRGKSGRVLDAHDYGYKSWRFFVFGTKKKSE